MPIFSPAPSPPCHTLSFFWLNGGADNDAPDVEESDSDTTEGADEPCEAVESDSDADEGADDSNDNCDNFKSLVQQFSEGEGFNFKPIVFDSYGMDIDTESE